MICVWCDEQIAANEAFVRLNNFESTHCACRIECDQAKEEAYENYKARQEKWGECR